MTKQTVKVPFQSLKVGDKFMVEATVKTVGKAHIEFGLPGASMFNCLYHDSSKSIEVEKLVPPKTTIVPGDRFRGQSGKIYIVDFIAKDGSIAHRDYYGNLYYDESDLLNKGYYTFIGNVNDTPSADDSDDTI